MPYFPKLSHQATAIVLLTLMSLPLSAEEVIDLTALSKAQSSVTLSSPLFAQESNRRLEIGQVINTKIKDKSLGIQVANDSKPNQGFFRLQTLTSDTGYPYNLGYVNYQKDRIVSVLYLPGQQPIRVVEKDGFTRATPISGKRAEPLIATQPKVINDKIKESTFSIKAASDFPVAPMESPPPPPFPEFTIDETYKTLILTDARVPGYAGLSAEQGVSADFEASVYQADSLTNSIFERSGLAYSHYIAGIHALELDTINTTYPNMDSGNILSELVSSGKAKRLLDRYNADGIHFIGNFAQEVCGRAWNASSINEDNEVRAVSGGYYIAYSDFNCLTDSTFTHELGHNLGLSHDRETLASDEQGGGTALDYHIPYGYIPDNLEFFTTMAYSRSCFRQDGQCYNEDIYSNPAVFIGDTPAGKEASEVDAADASSAVSLTLPTASLLRFRHDYYPIEATANDGNIELTPKVTGAETLRASTYCSSTGYLPFDTLDSAQELSSGQTLLVPEDSWGQPICFYGEKTDSLGFKGYALVAEYQANRSTNNSLLVKNNVIQLFEKGDSAEVTIQVSDDSIENSDIGLAMRYDEELMRPDLADASAQAEQWFDYSLSGSGTERTLTLTLKTSLEKISAEMAAGDQRNAYQLPLSVYDTRTGPEEVSSVIWIEETAYQPMPVTAYFTLGNSIEAESDFGVEAVLKFVPDGVTPVLEQTSDFKVNNFSYYVERDGVNYNVVLTGEVPYIPENRRWEVTAKFSHENVPDVTLPLTAVSMEGVPSFTELEVVNPVSGSENEVKIDVSVQDNDGNLNLNNFKLDLYYPTGEQENFITDIGDWSDLSTTINLGSLEPGEYQVNASITDYDDNLAEETVYFEVVEDRPIEFAEIIEPEGIVRTNETFSMGFTLVEDRNPVEAISWVGEGPGNVEFGSATEKTTDITIDTAGEYLIKVWVDDIYGGGSGFSYTLNVTDNQPPSVEIIEASNLSVDVGTSVTLTAIAEDPDEEISDFVWEQVSGSTLSVSGSNTDTLTIDASAAGSFGFKVTVTDSEGESANAEVTLQVSATNNGGGSDTGTSGGSASYLFLLLLASSLLVTRRSLMLLRQVWN